MLQSGTSIRRKLLALVLLPLVGVLPLLGAILLWWSGDAIDELLRTKVRSDLAVARGYFERVMAEVGTGAATVAESHGLRVALQARDPSAMQSLLQQWRERSGVSYLNWRSPDGRLVVAHWGAAEGAPVELLGERDGRPHVAVIDGAEFGRLAPQARDQVAVPLLPTQGARATTRGVEDRAMVITAAAPVRDANGALLGHVQAGVLLNRNLAFIDRINDIVPRRRPALRQPRNGNPVPGRCAHQHQCAPVRTGTVRRSRSRHARHRYPRVANGARSGA